MATHGEFATFPSDFVHHRLSLDIHSAPLLVPIILDHISRALGKDSLIIRNAPTPFTRDLEGKARGTSH